MKCGVIMPGMENLYQFFSFAQSPNGSWFPGNVARKVVDNNPKIQPVISHAITVLTFSVVS